MIEKTEKLIPVTSESQLKVGQLLETKGCEWCGKTCRPFLVANVNGTSACYEADGSKIENCRGAHFEAWTCTGNGVNCWSESISKGHVFIVDTGLTVSGETEKTLEIVR